MHTDSNLCKKASSLPLLIAMVVLASLAFAVQASSQQIITYNAPNAGTAAWQGTIGVGIAPNGAVTGWYIDAQLAAHGFLRTPDGQFTSFDAPGAGSGPGPCPISNPLCGSQGTHPFGINPKGVITGPYVDASDVFHGFVRTPDGKIASFDAPGAGTNPRQGTWFGDINPPGAIAGFYKDANYVAHGLLRTPEGEFILFDAPGAGTGGGQGTFPQFFSCLNPDGTITGFYLDGDNVYHGFVRHPDGSFTTFDAPNAGYGEGQGTLPYSINRDGETTGQYFDASNLSHGFVRRQQGSFTTIDAPGAAQGTIPEGNNAQGQVEGQYVDSNGDNHGFVFDRNGKLLTFNATGAGTGAGQGTIPMTNNAEGMISGYYLDGANVYHGFLRMPH